MEGGVKASGGGGTGTGGGDAAASSVDVGGAKLAAPATARTGDVRSAAVHQSGATGEEASPPPSGKRVRWSSEAPDEFLLKVS